MPLRLTLLCCFLALCIAAAAQTPPTGAQIAAQNDVTWHSPGANENDSMPLGNGSLGANVWTESNGDLVLLVSSPDAWTGMDKLVKLNRVRLHLTPNPFAGSKEFTQTLRLEDGSLQISAGHNKLRVWIDANHPAIHVQGHTTRPVKLRVSLETWRRNQSIKEAAAEAAGMLQLGGDHYPVTFHADTILPARPHSIAWYHYNTQSIYPTVLRAQHLSPLLGRFPDPLMHRCFGTLITGTGLRSQNNRTLTSGPRRNFRVDVVARVDTQPTSPEAWQTQLYHSLLTANPAHLSAAWAAHKRWWRSFWNRAWIQVTGGKQAQQVTQGFLMQRYMMAASSRGQLPVKFNGGIFTVGHDMPRGVPSTSQNHNPDYRAWGNAYWNQNNRLLYWPLLATGDNDLLKPWFRMYTSDLAFEKARTELYTHHAGASYPETMFFWGTPGMFDFGWNNPTDQIESRWQRYHIQGSLEVLSQMLDEYQNTGNMAFAKSSIVPLASAVVTYYALQWPLGPNGKFLMSPTQSLETYQLTAVDPTPDIAGLRSVLPRLLALPASITTPQQRAFWTRTLHEVPAIPVGRTAANGKIPPHGIGAQSGKRIILPALDYGPPRNVENPELYSVFPYHLYGVGKPHLRLARNTFRARLFPQDTCWGQDGTEAAALGLTSEAQRAVTAEFTDYGNQRFQWFWQPGHDWIPDLDNGGSGMITLEEMLLQPDGRKLLLLPAWPANWSADFKLHAPFETTVEGRVVQGQLVQLTVSPKSRAKDVVVVSRKQ
uniref:DUF5703 domain-containing protein n=1 Tax=Acidobacterium capsulatum TaxID=33075 RepID=A0A7V5CTI7_9BACT